MTLPSGYAVGALTLSTSLSVYTLWVLPKGGVERNWNIEAQTDQPAPKTGRLSSNPLSSGTAKSGAQWMFPSRPVQRPVEASPIGIDTTASGPDSFVAGRSYGRLARAQPSRPVNFTAAIVPPGAAPQAATAPSVRNVFPQRPSEKSQASPAPRLPTADSTRLVVNSSAAEWTAPAGNDEYAGPAEGEAAGGLQPFTWQITPRAGE